MIRPMRSSPQVSVTFHVLRKCSISSGCCILSILSKRGHVFMSVLFLSFFPSFVFLSLTFNVLPRVAFLRSAFLFPRFIDGHAGCGDLLFTVPYPSSETELEQARGRLEEGTREEKKKERAVMVRHVTFTSTKDKRQQVDNKGAKTAKAARR